MWSSQSGRVLFAKLNLQRYSQLATLHEALADRFYEYHQVVMQQFAALPPALHPYQQPFALMNYAPGFMAAVPDVNVNELVRLLVLVGVRHQGELAL